MSQPALLAEPVNDTVLGVERSAMDVRWKWRTMDERAVLTLSQKLAIPDLLARILVGRGITLEEAENYLSPSLKASMPDPAHLKDMDKAIARLLQAVAYSEKVGVFGDYDVDGATSSALLCRYFHAIGLGCETYIPDRMKEGYGPNEAALLWLKEQGVSVVVTVDCGAVAFEALAAAKAAGLDVIVLDHHIGAAQLPEAVAVVNPNRLDETSSCGHLAAVGVVFLTLVALNRALREAGFFAGRAEPNLLDWLDLVALGTVCDVVPLTGLNRAFVRQGLHIMAHRRNPGIRALLEAAGLEELPSTYHAGFILGPRINAGGRVGEAPLGLRLLTCSDMAEAADIAARLSRYNAERQAIEAQVLEEAFAQAERQDNRSVILVAKEGWHEGVIGIVAGRIKERFHRPCAVVAISGEKGKGSARSVPGVDFGAAIAAARTEGLLLTGGGHAMAAGFSVERDRIAALHDYLEARLGTSSEQYRHQRTLSIDACLNPDAMSLELADIVARAAPFGTANPTPRFVLAHCRILAANLVNDAHIRVTLACESRKGQRNTAIAFRCVGTPLGELLLHHHGRSLHLAGQLKKEFWQGQARLSFFIDDAAFAA